MAAAFPGSPSSPGDATPGMLFYNFNSSRGQVIHPSSMWSVRDIKEAVQQRESVSADSLRIIYKGAELEDNKPLRECNLESMSTVHVLQSTRRSFSTTELMAKAKNQFYVYCAECKTIAEGKIIVRCAECQLQSFVVKKGPKSWDEVLVKQTDIHGSCLSETCKSQSPQGKYTIHCSAHKGSDVPPEALPLPLLRVNTVSVHCMNCGQVDDPVLVFPCDDRHAMCVPCFKVYVELALNSHLFERDPRTEMYTLGCPAGCPDSYIPDPHNFRAAPELYERYKDFAVEDMVLKSGGVVCGCGQKIMCEQYDQSDDSDDNTETEGQAAASSAQPRRLSLKCETCDKSYCTKCKQPWHKKTDCTAPTPEQRPKDEMQIAKEAAALACWRQGTPDPCIEAFQKDLQDAKEKWLQSHKKKRRWWPFSFG